MTAAFLNDRSIFCDPIVNSGPYRLQEEEWSAMMKPQEEFA